MAPGEEERIDRTFGLSEYMASHEGILPTRNTRSGGDGSQEHGGEDSQPPPLQDEEMPASGPPAVAGSWCRTEGIACPLCPDVVASQPRNLVRHLAAMHRGQQLGEAGASTLRGCEQGICLGCKGIRSFKSTQCLHCAPPIRPPRRAEAEDTIRCPAPVERIPCSQPATQSAAQLPEGWVARCRALPSQTIVHIPRTLRDAHTRIMTYSLGALIADAKDCNLEQGRSKLLLGPVPKELHNRTELQLRLRLWQEGDFEALLVRRELQAAASQLRSRRRTGNNSARARQLVREGAYRKGVTALTGAMAALTPEQEVRWAKELLPNKAMPATQEAAPLESSPVPLPGGAVEGSQANADAEAAEPAQDRSPAKSHDSLWKQALGGARFPALSAAGPSGARPEHLKESLGKF